MMNHEPCFTQRIFEQAVAWFVALQSQDCDAALQARFERWRDQDTAHARAYDEAEKLWSNLDELKVTTVPGLAAARKARPQRLPVRHAGALAVLAAALTGWWQDYTADTQLYSTAIGERRSIELADGSHLDINAASQLSVRQSWWRRDVVLLQGDALFSVAHRAFPSFTVQVGDLEIRDIGTRFAVRQRLEGTQISVFEGEVALRSGRAWLGDSLKAGYSRRIDKQGRMQAIEVLKPEQAAWLDGHLVFDHAPLAEVVAELERYHPLKFMFADSNLAGETVSGNFATDDLKPFLRALEVMLPIRVQRQKQTIVLSRR